MSTITPVVTADGIITYLEWSAPAAGSLAIPLLSTDGTTFLAACSTPSEGSPAIPVRTGDGCTVLMALTLKRMYEGGKQSTFPLVYKYDFAVKQCYDAGPDKLPYGVSGNVDLLRRFATSLTNDLYYVVYHRPWDGMIKLEGLSNVATIGKQPGTLGVDGLGVLQYGLLFKTLDNKLNVRRRNGDIQVFDIVPDSNKMVAKTRAFASASEYITQFLSGGTVYSIRYQRVDTDVYTYGNQKNNFNLGHNKIIYNEERCIAAGPESHLNTGIVDICMFQSSQRTEDLCCVNSEGEVWVSGLGAFNAGGWNRAPIGGTGIHFSKALVPHTHDRFRFSQNATFLTPQIARELPEPAKQVESYFYKQMKVNSDPPPYADGDFIPIVRAESGVCYALEIVPAQARGLFNVKTLHPSGFWGFDDRWYSVVQNQGWACNIQNQTRDIESDGNLFLTSNLPVPIYTMRIVWQYAYDPDTLDFVLMRVGADYQDLNETETWERHGLYYYCTTKQTFHPADPEAPGGDDLYFTYYNAIPNYKDTWIKITELGETTDKYSISSNAGSTWGPVRSCSQGTAGLRWGSFVGHAVDDVWKGPAEPPAPAGAVADTVYYYWQTHWLCSSDDETQADPGFQPAYLISSSTVGAVRDWTPVEHDKWIQTKVTTSNIPPAIPSGDPGDSYFYATVSTFTGRANLIRQPNQEWELSPIGDEPLGEEYPPFKGVPYVRRSPNAWGVIGYSFRTLNKTRWCLEVRADPDYNPYGHQEMPWHELAIIEHEYPVESWQWADTEAGDDSKYYYRIGWIAIKKYPPFPQSENPAHPVMPIPPHRYWNSSGGGYIYNYEIRTHNDGRFPIVDTWYQIGSNWWCRTVGNTRPSGVYPGFDS